MTVRSDNQPVMILPNIYRKAYPSIGSRKKTIARMIFLTLCSSFLVTIQSPLKVTIILLFFRDFMQNIDL